MAGARTVAVVGATGAVGQEMLRVLEQRDFPVGRLRPMASARSAGSRLCFRGREFAVEALEGADFDGVDVALFSIGAELAREHGPRAAEAGAVVVDNSTAFRMEPDVPLVVPEVNGELLASRPRIVANPNCCAVPLVVVLHALRRAAALKRVIVTTFQSVSGTGKDAMDELREQAGAWLEGRESPPRVYPRPIAFNCLPHVDAFQDNGYTREEMKITAESRKMLGLPDLLLSATCVRVPVFRAHSESVTVEFERPVTPQQALDALRSAAGVELRGEPGAYPTPRDAEGGDLTLVGRVREDVSHPGGIALWLTCDNLRKGAALNAIQIAERYL
ncbi:MAG: aspartate-semialdehyde dehydrogenase [Candidatus Eisenbacteria bacterium]|nr:aspartate-semialdehyde dehydrogenase [Candidatus Eisenbacteria bacterium]